MAKRFLAILSRYLWPIDSGRKESMIHYFQALHEQYGYEIRLLCFPEAGQTVDPDKLPPYIVAAEGLKDVPPMEIAWNLLSRTFGSVRWPIQCSFYYGRRNAARIREVVRQWKPDVVFTEMIRTCTYYEPLRESNALLLANLDDLLSVRYRRQALAGVTRANIAGNYAGKLSGGAALFLRNGVLKNMVLRLEAERCERWEKKFYQLYDWVLLTSDTERDKLNSVMKGAKAKTLSVGVDCDYYSAELPLKRDPIGLSYVGNLNVSANADTLEMIVTQILPLLKSDYRYYVIGNCPDAVREKYQANERILFQGRVDDLRKAVRETAVFLAPIAYGTGVKTKIVEAMAAKMPVVTNSVGAEGIPAVSGRDFIVRETPGEIAAAVDELLSSPSYAMSIGENAGRFARERFNWERVLSVFQEIGLQKEETENVLF